MDPTASAPVHSPIELDIERVRGLIGSRQFASALALAEALATQVPENRDVLYLMALSQRHLSQIPAALATLQRLEQHHPGYSRLYQERGHCYVVLRNALQAIDAFLRGVNLNPALPTSWSMLEGLYRMTGQAQNAAMAAAHVATLEALPPQIVTASGFFSDGDLGPAESIVRAFLLEQGNHIEGMRLLARIALRRAVLDDAELLLEAVLQAAPDYQAARFDYAQTLVERHEYGRARAELERLLTLDPTNRQYKTLYATTIVGLGEHDKAIALYRELLRDRPRSPELHLSVAHSLKTLGRRAEAILATAMPPRLGRILAMPTGAWPISRPTASRRMRFHRCVRRKRPQRPRRSTAIICVLRSVRHWRTAEIMRSPFATTSGATL
jgi:predicted Zn-dependent protease